MTTESEYYDIRAEFWKKHFEAADTYEGYLENAEPVYVKKWEDLSAALPVLKAEDRARLNGYGRSLKVLVYCTDWCGDCVRQIPMIKEIAEAAGPEVELRLVDRDESEALKDELRILGAMRVPVVVFLNEDFHEVARVGDRSLITYRRKLVTETGAACDTGLIAPPEEALAAERGEWMDHFERVLIMLRLSPPLRKKYGD